MFWGFVFVFQSIGIKAQKNTLEAGFEATNSHFTTDFIAKNNSFESNYYIDCDIPEVLTSGLCENNLNLTFTTHIPSGTFTDPYFIWQKSSDNGVTWVNLIDFPTGSDSFSVEPGSYFNNDLYRFIVAEYEDIVANYNNLGSCTNCHTSDTVKIVIKANVEMPTVSDITYCYKAIASPLTAIGSNLRWYNSATGGTGSVNAPTPTTGTPGFKNYWVSQTIDGCEGPRATITVYINDPPPPGSQQSFLLSECHCCSANCYWQQPAMVYHRNWRNRLSYCTDT